MSWRCIFSNYWMRLNRIRRILKIIHSKYFLVLKGVSPFRSLFFCSPNITQSRPQVFSVNGSIICSGLHFWCHWFNNFQRAVFLTSLIQYDDDSLQIWWTAAGYGNYACGFINKPIRNGEIFWMNDLQNSSYPTQPHSIIAKYFSCKIQ